MPAGEGEVPRKEETALEIVGGRAEGPVLALGDGISFWGGIDPETGRIVDVHHPNHGDCVSSTILLMPTSRGSCSGSGVLLELALTGRAPAAIVFCEDEEILTLGALVADRIFGRAVPVLRLPRSGYEALARSKSAALGDGRLRSEHLDLALDRADVGHLDLSDRDRSFLDGASGPAARLAIEVLCLMAVAQGADRLMDVTRGHIDGCILAHSANLIFAEKLAGMGAKVAIPTTINAISVDRERWRAQGVDEEFGSRASRLADAYVAMGVAPTFTCAPYLLDDAPHAGEPLGWSESNAVIFANSVLGARTAKHPDYLDLFIAMTGRAPLTGVYADPGRVPRRIVDFDLPAGHDDLFWPMVGWLTGQRSPDRVPLVTGLERARPTRDDLKALCAAFGTTSGVPMMHIAGHTPEAGLAPSPEAERVRVTTADLRAAWHELNAGPGRIDLVAIGSPHSSLAELRRMADLFAARRAREGVSVIVTLGRGVLKEALADGTLARLERAGVRLIPDLCWCSITEPVFPQTARGVITNSGKYAHYAHGLSGRHVRFAGLADCVEAAVTGRSPEAPPDWLSG